MNEDEKRTRRAADGVPNLGGRVLSRRDVLRGAAAAGVGTSIAMLAPGGISGAAAKFPVGAAARAKSKPVSITMWHSMTSANLTTLQNLTKQFNASQSNVRVNLVNQTSYIDTLTAYTTALSGGQLPDIVQWETSLIQVLIDSKSVVPVGAAIAADHYSLSDFVPSMVDFFKVGGTQWALPFNVSSQVMYYDQNVLSKAGLDPTNPPANLTQLRSAARKIVSSGAAKYGVSLKIDATNFELWMALGGKTLVNKNNGRSGRATAVTFDNAFGQSIFNWWGGMLSDKLAQSTPFTTFDNLLAIGNGIAPLTFDTSAALGTILQVLGQYPKLKLGVAPLPLPTTKRAKNGGAFIGGAGLYIVKKPTPETTPETQDAAWQFIKFLIEPASQATWSIGTGYVPVRKSAVSLPALTQAWAAVPGYRVAYKQLLSSPQNAATAGYVAGAALQIDTAIQDQGIAPMASGGSPKQSLTAAASAANAAISSYNERV